MTLRSVDFESTASTNSATRASNNFKYLKAETLRVLASICSLFKRKEGGPTEASCRAVGKE